MKVLAPNTMIQNRYLVVHPIGKGGMGEVYLAVDQRLGSAVALKRTRFESDSELGKAFEREAKILARLRHPVLPKVIDHFMEGDGQFLVMEHISGDDLGKRLESAGKPFPLSWVMFWADQLLDALNYLHSHEPPIIHRDIKPQNLKLTDDNHIVLLDFGLSKDFESVNTGGSSGVGSIVGYSPGFAPMEQVRGTGTDARSDLYSLAATLYQMLTNATPPDALTRVDEMLGGSPDPARALNQINPEVPSAVSDVILKGMSVRQDERFATAAEMQKALRRAFNQSKDEAPKTEKPEESTKPTEVPAQVVVAKAEPEPEVENAPSEQAAPVGAGTFDATVKMEPAEMETVLKQSDVKTAVLSGGALGISDALAENAPKPSPIVVPIGKVEDQHETTQKPAPVAAAVAAGAGSQAAPKSKTGLIIAILVGLFIIGGVAAGGGWYAYKRMNAGPVTTPSPIASPVAATPQPTETQPLVAQDANENTAVTESNTASTNSNSVTGPTTTKTPAKTTPTSGPKTTSTPKPKERTVILQ